jgi:hypothetical protein
MSEKNSGDIRSPRFFEGEAFVLIQPTKAFNV